ncbi:Paired immunoglobulin-like type 2 receptor alpha [Frankliniella fusca]|uniref:Paired immunoglobulin-like type 2 receptor alpha n=1 Tax=Frankliniella fusca TaxID=407009 RepID=A0AAE1LLX1_9NEOP|nr:Paired immunoglobulin-like type 2 receptor alpha [Frankliniella fusca]
MERRDVVLLAVLGLVALLLLLGAGAAALWWVRRRRKREADEEAATKEPVKQRNNGFLSLKTPLISTKTLGFDAQLTQSSAACIQLRSQW